MIFQKTKNKAKQKNGISTYLIGFLPLASITNQEMNGEDVNYILVSSNTTQEDQLFINRNLSNVQE